MTQPVTKKELCELLQSATSLRNGFQLQKKGSGQVIADWGIGVADGFINAFTRMLCEEKEEDSSPDLGGASIETMRKLQRELNTRRMETIDERPVN